MARSNIVELTTDQVIEQNTSKFFRPVYSETPAIPDTYAGKYAVLAAIAVNVALTEEQMDALETAIEGITGVHKAFVLIGPARIPTDRVPEGTDLVIGVEGKFDIKPTPEA